MHEQLPATLASVRAARQAVTRFATDLNVDLDGIALAVSEAVANAVAHGYAGDSHGMVELSATASPLEVTVTVRDRGRGFAYPGGTSGAGYGLQLMRRLAQRVELAEASDGGVQLTMAFRRGDRWSSA
jgi:anti-sigma regulatory factor (Ser/Thr protein kinase)